MGLIFWKRRRRALLRRARELVAAGWCREANARNAAGERVCYTNSTAKSFCASGALLRARSELEELGTWLTYDAAKKELRRATWWRPGWGRRWGGIVAYNDEPGRTQAEVVAAFDGGLAALRTELRARAEGRKA